MINKFFIYNQPNSSNPTSTSSFDLFNKPGCRNIILPIDQLDRAPELGIYEASLIDWCKIFGNKDKVFLDIGAHTGTYSAVLAPHFRNVWAFEPQRMTYYGLCGTIALSSLENVRASNVALGSEDQVGYMDLHIRSEDGGGSSLISIDGAFKTERVQVRTLDSFNIPEIGFIKIDAEGNELNILKGSLHSLMQSNYPKIMFECNEDGEELFQFLNDLQYKIIPINGYWNMFLAERE